MTVGQELDQRFNEQDELISNIGEQLGDTNLVLDTIAGRLDELEGAPAPPPTNSSGFAFSGFVNVDSFSGSDSDKLDQAMTYARTQTYKPTLYLSNRRWQFIRPITAYTGFKLTGANWSSVEQPRSNNPYATMVDIDLGGSTTPWLTFPSGNTFGCYVGNISFEGSGKNTQWAAANSGVCWTSVFENLGFSAFRHVFGRPNQKFLMTAVVMQGYWNINNCYDTAITAGGSDNTLFVNGGLIDSPPSFIGDPAGKYHVRLDYMSKSTIGPVYMTCDRLSGILVTGNHESSTQGHTVIHGARIEGRNANTPCYGSLIRIQGGGVTLRDCWLGFAMTNPASGANSGDKGAVHLERGSLLMDGCTYGRGNADAPILYATGNRSHARAANIMPTWNTDAVKALPSVRVENGAHVTVDGYNANGQIDTSARFI